MYTVFILCCLILPTLAHHLSAEETAFLKKVQLACQDDPKTFVDEDLLKNLPENKDKPQVAIHMFCLSKEVGLQKSNGNLDKAVIKEKISLVTHDRSAIDGLVEKCAVAKETPEKTALSLWLCFVQNDIHYYHYDFWNKAA